MTATLQRPDGGHVLAAIPVPILLIDPANRIAFANDASEAFFGRSKRKLEGGNVAELLQFASERMNSVLETRENDVSAQDMELSTPQGTITVDLSISVMPSDPDWRLLLLSPRHGGREHISEHKDKGQQQSMGAPAILGHEIKNPLAGIKGAAQLLARRVGEGDRALTDLIVNEVDRIARLLDQMQRLGGPERAELAPANVHLLIERAIRSIRAANRAMPEISINYDHIAARCYDRCRFDGSDHHQLDAECSRCASRAARRRDRHFHALCHERRASRGRCRSQVDQASGGNCDYRQRTRRARAYWGGAVLALCNDQARRAGAWARNRPEAGVANGQPGDFRA